MAPLAGLLYPQVTLWLVECDPDVLLTGNGNEGLWVTGPGDPERAKLGAGGSGEASPESWGQTSQVTGFGSSSRRIPDTPFHSGVPTLGAQRGQEAAPPHVCGCVQPKWVHWHQGEGRLGPPCKLQRATSKSIQRLEQLARDVGRGGQWGWG